ncbi:MAG: DUF4298 domain-containing protein [Prevotella sp.]|nr:DUF4298 domain-containing protein [Prevotella sp.]
MKQTERITQMEQRLDRLSVAVMDLSSALDKYESALEDRDILSQYYGSKEWKKDFNDDEAGLLPNDLKRGVLSEDALWNVLADCRELNIRLSALITKILQR